MRRLKDLSKQVKQAATLEEVFLVLDVVEAKGIEFDGILAATTLCTLARLRPSLRSSDGPSMDGVSKLVDRMGGALAALAGAPSAHLVLPSDMAPELRSLIWNNAAWALAALQRRAPVTQPLLPVVLDGIARDAQHMTPQHVAVTFRALALLKAPPELGERMEQALAALQTRAVALLPDFTTQGLAYFCWGLAALRRDDRTCLAAVSRLIVQWAPGLSDKAARKDLPPVASAVASLGVRDDALMAAIARRSAEVLREASSWEVCALAWSYAKLYPTSLAGLQAGAAADALAAPPFVGFRRLVDEEVQRRGLSQQAKQSPFISERVAE